LACRVIQSRIRSVNIKAPAEGLISRRRGPQKGLETVDALTISPAGDPFHAAPDDRDHPHACLNGYVYLDYTVFDEETGEEVERVEALPCRRCVEEVETK
jgi:hypothetical protein